MTRRMAQSWRQISDLLMVIAEIWSVEILRLDWNLSAFGEWGILLSALALHHCPPTLFSPQENSPLLRCPVSCPQFGMLPSGNDAGGEQRDALASQSQALPAPAPQHSSGFPHSPPPKLLALKGLWNKKMREKRLQGFISLDPLLINYWSDI